MAMIMRDDQDAINGVIASIDGEVAHLPFESVNLIPDDRPLVPDFLPFRDALVRFSANVVFDSNLRKLMDLVRALSYDFRPALRAHHRRRCPWGARYL